MGHCCGFTNIDEPTNQASISDASDLPWELSRGTNNPIESLEDDTSSTSERPLSRKTASPRKRNKKETPRKESDKNETDEEKKHEEVNADWIPEEALSSKQEMRECLFDVQELLA